MCGSSTLVTASATSRCSTTSRLPLRRVALPAFCRASGAGKSTLLDIVAGVLTPSRGCVLLGDRALPAAGFAGYMLQRDGLLPWRTVLGNVVLAAQVRGSDRARAQQDALALLDAFGLADFAHAHPQTLSGGMRQRVALARTVMVSRELLLLDEPLSALDALTRWQLQRWLGATIARLGATTIMVTHDIREALLLSDRIVVMSARPARVLAVYDVPAARPRRPGQLHTAAMQGLEHRLLNHLAPDMDADMDADIGNDTAAPA
ncbi:MAG: ATP-binding cassette domain-containing protein [Trueperaceae bacterium]|nr:ATP-binding cassette domain-containing protein [Trueperaceae bacterium]